MSSGLNGVLEVFFTAFRAKRAIESRESSFKVPSETCTKGTKGVAKARDKVPHPIDVKRLIVLSSESSRRILLLFPDYLVDKSETKKNIGHCPQPLW